jgi:hypothetical protein
LDTVPVSQVAMKVFVCPMCGLRSVQPSQTEAVACWCGGVSKRMDLEEDPASRPVPQSPVVPEGTVLRGVFCASVDEVSDWRVPIA